MTKQADYDAAVIGASIAGSATATLLARAGARVALIERKPDRRAFKRVCGHFIQPSAVPVLERLGLLRELESAGGFRGHGRVWTSAGWIARESNSLPPSLSVRREVLDPLLRAQAADTPGVELLCGHTLDGLDRGGEITQLSLRTAAGRSAIRARLIVGADGRGSRTAELAGLHTRRSPNVRIAYFGYFEGPALEPEVSVKLWLLDPDVGIATPTDGGLILYVAMPHESRRDEFKADPEGALRRFTEALPDAPPIGASRLVGSMIGKLDMSNESRPLVAPGLALVGDAALTADPVAAIGCGFALQSAEWLADSLAPAVAGSERLESGLARYRQVHRRRLRGHALMLNDFAKRERMSHMQRLLFSAAVHDQVIAERLGQFAGRLIGPSKLLTPALLARAAAVNRRARRSPSTTSQAGAVAPSG